MRALAIVAAFVAGALGSVCVLAGDSALDQLKAYTESSTSTDKPAPAHAGPPDIVGIRLGMPLREAFALLQTKYPAQKLGTEAVRLPAIEKPVLSQFSTGLVPVASPDEWITVDLTPPPNAQVVWRAQRHLGRQKIHRTTLLASLRQKYGKESAELADDITDDPHATDLWWFYDEQWRVTNPHTRNVNVDITNCARWSSTVSWFAPNNVTRSAPDLNENSWCNSATTLVHARLPPDEIVTSLVVEMYSIPLAVRSAKAELAWLNGMQQQQHEQDVRESKQNKPKL